MGILEHYFSNIEEQLNIDEQLLNDVPLIQKCFLRLWEVTRYCVVLGKGNTLETEVYESECMKDEVSILRRSSGGGTVVLGPGCLNYSIITPLNLAPQWQSISQTTQYIMTKHAQALNKQLEDVNVAGISDLVYKGKKFSGNAQRRTREALLFHGTFLYNFDIQKVERYLKFPTKHPEYREKRSHNEFIGNLPLKRAQLIACLKECWRV